MTGEDFLQSKGLEAVRSKENLGHSRWHIGEQRACEEADLLRPLHKILRRMLEAQQT